MTDCTEKFIELYTKYIKRPGAEELMKWLRESDFFTAPASTRFHGSYPGGLCEHSVHVWEELVRLLKAYPEVKVSGETAAIVTLLHDLCKVGVYNIELRNKKDALLHLRFQHAINQLDNPHKITDVKRDIARVMTVLREKNA